MSKQSGGCHCGNVRFEVTVDLTKPVMACNCSICSKKGHLLTFVDESQFHLIKGDDHLSDYLFNKKKIHHLFCRTCGVGSFAKGTKPSGEKMIAINARCIDGVDIATLTIQQIDGKNF